MVRILASAACFMVLPFALTTSCKDDPPGPAGTDLCLGTDPSFVFSFPAGSDFRYTDEACRAFLDQERQRRVYEDARPAPTAAASLA
jgi:hypothetical protein